MTVRLTGLLGVLLLVSNSYAQDDPKELRKQAKAKIKEFKKDLRGKKDEQEIIGLIRGLGEMKHNDILKELAAQLRNHRNEDILITIIDEIGKYKQNETAAAYLLGTLSNYAGRASKGPDGGDQGHSMAVAVLGALGEVKDLKSAKKLTSYFEHINITLAKAAITTTGKIGNVELADSLISILLKLETTDVPRNQNMPNAPPGYGQPPPGMPGLPPGGVPGAPPGMGAPPGYDPQQQMRSENLRRKRILEPAVKTALKDMTGHSEQNANKWSSWWGKNRRKFFKKQKEEEAARKKRQKGK